MIYCGLILQDVLWQVVDASLRDIRQGYFAALEDYWSSTRVYEAQVHAKQVRVMLSASSLHSRRDSNQELI